MGIKLDFWVLVNFVRNLEAKGHHLSELLKKIPTLIIKNATFIGNAAKNHIFREKFIF